MKNGPASNGPKPSSSARRALRREEADLLNYHLAVSHSLIEDTALFAVMGIPVLILILPRLALAEITVWGRKLVVRLVQRRKAISRGR
jgi:hypothetical protein